MESETHLAEKSAIVPKDIRFPIYFKNARQGQLLIPGDLSREDYELLRLQIDYTFETIEGALLPPSPVNR